MTEFLQAEHITKSFSNVKAVNDLSFAVNQGEFFALLGPSGCGKTTLLRIIAGFENPDSGTLMLDGKEISGLRPNRRPVNLMFQSYALFPHMSVAANIRYGLEMEGVKGAELRKRVSEALELVHLTNEADRKPHQLSGGQRQRVALARSLVKRPKLLLLDEPLGALDRKLREQMQIELKNLQKQTGITFIVVTHDQEEALSMADRIALLNQGQIVQIGSPRELYQRPISYFAAEFIGQMNFFKVQRNRSGMELDGLGNFPIPSLAAIHEGQRALLAVRPESIRLYAEGSEDRLTGYVAGAAFLGQDLTVHLRLEANGKILIARLSAADPLATSLIEGQKLFCNWAPGDAHILAE